MLFSDQLSSQFTTDPVIFFLSLRQRCWNIQGLAIPEVPSFSQLPSSLNSLVPFSFLNWGFHTCIICFDQIYPPVSFLHPLLHPHPQLTALSPLGNMNNADHILGLVGASISHQPYLKHVCNVIDEFHLEPQTEWAGNEVNAGENMHIRHLLFLGSSVLFSKTCKHEKNSHGKTNFWPWSFRGQCASTSRHNQLWLQCDHG